MLGFQRSEVVDLRRVRETHHNAWRMVFSGLRLWIYVGCVKRTTTHGASVRSRTLRIARFSENIGNISGFQRSEVVDLRQGA